MTWQTAARGMRVSRLSWLAMALIAWVGCTSGAAARDAVQAKPVASASVHGTARMQVHRTWVFPEDGITFSNRLMSARLNDVQRLGPDRYAITIEPEDSPINPSPWYGFSMTARRPSTVHVEFRYKHGKQRYWPKLSTDGEHWHPASDEEFGKEADGRYVLTADLGAEPLQVFAQKPLGPDTFARWEMDLSDKAGVRVSTIGHSVQGRPLTMLRFGNPEADQVVLVIGRQHPPEVTGSRALLGFVDRMTGDTPLASEFRSRMLVLVVPLMNPDGVVEGNWRGNADGKDLNRDWGTFTEPETRAVHELMRREIDQPGRQLAFAIDFHSTWNDVLYTVKESPARKPGGVMRRWIDALQAHYPGSIREKANDAKGTVFKNWAFRHYRAPTVTYEVGDKTHAGHIDELSTFAADQLMRILLDPEQPRD